MIPVAISTTSSQSSRRPPLNRPHTSGSSFLLILPVELGMHAYADMKVHMCRRACVCVVPCPHACMRACTHLSSCKLVAVAAILEAAVGPLTSPARVLEHVRLHLKCARVSSCVHMHARAGSPARLDGRPGGRTYMNPFSQEGPTVGCRSS